MASRHMRRLVWVGPSLSPDLVRKVAALLPFPSPRPNRCFLHVASAWIPSTGYDLPPSPGEGIQGGGLLGAPPVSRHPIFPGNAFRRLSTSSRDSSSEREDVRTPPIGGNSQSVEGPEGEEGLGEWQIEEGDIEKGHAKGDLSRLDLITLRLARDAFFGSVIDKLRMEGSALDSGEARELLRGAFLVCWNKHVGKTRGKGFRHFASCCLLVAAHRVAGPWLAKDPENFRKFLTDALGGLAVAHFGILGRAIMFFRQDKLAYVGGMMDRMEKDLDSYHVSERRSTQDCQELRVLECMHVRILSEEGIPEYTTVFCALERQWFDMLRLEKNGIDFSLPKVIANGDDKCIFRANRQ